MRTKILLCLILLLCSTGCNAEELPPFEKWAGYTSQDGTMSVKFPDKPKIQTLSENTVIGTLKFRIIMYENSAKDVALLISKVKYPVDPSQYDAKKGLEGALQGAAARVKGKIVSQKDIQMYGLPGKEATIKVGKDLTMRARFFIDPKGPTLYLIQVISKKSVVSGADAFFDSFDIKTKKAKRPKAKKTK